MEKGYIFMQMAHHIKDNDYKIFSMVMALSYTPMEQNMKGNLNLGKNLVKESFNELKGLIIQENSKIIYSMDLVYTIELMEENSKGIGAKGK